jgi:ribonuclease P protein component
VVSNILKSLKAEKDFKRIKSEGKRKRLEPWLLMVYLPSPDAHHYVGFSISSRYLNSVKKNRVKRVFKHNLRMIRVSEKGFLVHFIVTRKVSAEEWSVFNEKKSSYYLSQMLQCFELDCKNNADFHH